MKKTIRFFKYRAWYPVKYFFINNYENLKRSISYACFGWKNDEQSDDCIYKMLLFKLKRIEKSLENDLVHEQNDATTLNLRKAIALAKTIVENKFMDGKYEAHEKKWGKFIFANGKAFQAKATTEAKKKQARKEFKALMEQCKKEKESTITEFFKIIQKNADYWWY